MFRLTCYLLPPTALSYTPLMSNRIRAVVTYVVFPSKDAHHGRNTDQCIVKVDVIDAPSGFTGELRILGELRNFRAGMIIEFNANVLKDFKQGSTPSDTVRFTNGNEVDPKTLKELTAYLTSVGIPERYATQIVKKEGHKAYAKILNDPAGLLTPYGATPDLIKKVLSFRVNPIDAKLHSWGFQAGDRKRINSFYEELDENEKQDRSLEKDLKENPYRLIDVSGLGFSRLDNKLTQHNVVPKDDIRRLTAMAVDAMNQRESEGHTCCTHTQLLEDIKHKFAAARTTLPEGLTPTTLIERAVQEGWIVKDADMYSKNSTYNAEMRVGTVIGTYLKKPRTLLRAPKNEHLKEQQQAGVKMGLTEPFSILTGGPGTGKTTSVKALVDALKSKNQTVWMCAPTGKAARRMAEVTGAEATTIHKRIVMIAKEREKRTRCDLLIVDEASMLSNELADDLLDSVKDRADRILFIGDPDQLPPIGPGRILSDLIKSGKVPVTQLTEIMRQSADNPIVKNAANIREGKSLEEDKSGLDGKADRFPITQRAPDVQLALIKKMLELRIKTYTKADGTPYDLLKDVQIIVPQNVGKLGTQEINPMMQNLLNPGLDENGEKKRELPGRNEPLPTLREGDKVLVTKNNKQAANGEIGRLVKIYTEKRIAEEKLTEQDVKGAKVPRKPFMKIEFPDRVVDLNSDYWNDVTLGYAITVHKSQGSEAPMVIGIFNRSMAPNMKQRNLLYTAITRPKERCWILTDSKDVLDECIATRTADQRQTRLKEVVDHPLVKVKKRRKRVVEEDELPLLLAPAVEGPSL